MFYKDINYTTVRDDKKSIGTIEYRYKIAQRKFSDRVAWERLQQNSFLYDGDTIRTADSAQARIIFKDHTVIEISELTMIQIFYNEESGVKLAVDSGDIYIDTTDSTQDISVDFSNGQSIKMESGSRIRANSSGENSESSIVVQSGQVQLESGEGENVVVSSGETVRVSEETGITKVPVSITSISDNIHLLSFDDNEKTVVLEWNTSDSQEKVPVVVETSFDRNFSKIEDTFVVEDSSSVNLDSPVGKMYWRVYLQDQSEEVVEGRITVDKVEDIVPVSPASNKEFTNASGKQNVNFSWKGNEYAKYYLLEVSSTADFSQPVVSQQIYGTSYTVSEMDGGSYFWRVTPFYVVNDIGYGKSTESLNFKITKQIFAKPPVLTLPVENARVSLDSSGAELMFMWKNYTQSTDAKLLVASDRNFNNLIYSQELSENRVSKKFEASLIPQGSYYWKVVSLTELDERGKYLESEIRSFNTVKYVPGENKLIYPPDNFAVEAPKIRTIDFMWKLAEEFNSSSTKQFLQISKDADFRTLVVDRELRDSYVSNISVESGNYWWRVGVSDSGNDFVYTKANRLNVLKELLNPKITYPAENATVAVQRENTVSVKWQPVEDSDYYVVKLISGDQVCAEQQVSGQETLFNLPSSMFETSTQKTLKCEVQAFAREKTSIPARSSKISKSEFTVRLPHKVELLSPADSNRIDGLAAFRSPVSFSWNKGDASSTQFILKKMQPNGSFQVVKTINNAGSAAKVSDLSAGTYEWSVKATSSEGLTLDSDKSFTFVVTPIPELAGARLTAPALNQVINSEYLVTNKAITFKWNAVAGAQNYQFILYQKLSNGRLKKITSLNTRNTEVKFTELALLDIGNFEWHVTAYSYNRSGVEEQRSRASIGRFQIDFGIPEEVETYTPSRMYGE